MQEPAAARAPRHHVRVAGGPYIDKVAHSYSSLLYTLAIMLAVGDMALSYSQLLAILLSLLLLLAKLHGTQGGRTTKKNIRSEKIARSMTPF